MGSGGGERQREGDWEERRERKYTRNWIRKIRKSECTVPTFKFVTRTQNIVFLRSWDRRKE